MYLYRPVLAAFALIVSADVSCAATQGDWDACTNGDPELSIAVCTRIIQDKSESAKDRAKAYNNRGKTYLNEK